MNNFLNTFLNFLRAYNKLLSNFFNKLNYKNFSILIVDKRLIITSGIIIASIVAHFSTPAFYKTERVKSLLENQLGNEFNFDFDLNNNLHYAIFPRPHFHFKKISLKAGKKEFATIDSFLINLSFKKFFDKEKLKIEYIKINKAKFNFETEDFSPLINFFDKKFSNLNVDILKSKVFLKDKENDTLSILNIDKAKIFHDIQYFKNRLNINGEIFNNPIIFNLKNDYETKDISFDIKLDKLGIQFKNEISYKNPSKLGSLVISNYGKNYSIDYLFDDKKFEFQSGKKTGEKYLYKGKALLKPFFLNTNINLSNLSLINLVQPDTLFMKLMRSNLFLNENLNLLINLRSQNIDDYRFLKDLIFKIELNQGLLNIKDTSLVFSDIAFIKLLNGNFRNKENIDSFIAEFEIDILDSEKLYKFFQTKKKYRKKISKINFLINYDFISQSVKIERFSIDNETSDPIQNFVRDFNAQDNQLKNRVELRNFFNLLIENYAG